MRRPDAPSRAAPTFAALGDATRLELLSRLGNGERRSITELSRGLTLSRQAVTKHLHVLSDAGIVDCKRVGRESRFAIRPKGIDQAKDYLSRISAQWDDAVARLRKAVEE